MKREKMRLTFQPKEVKKQRDDVHGSAGKEERKEMKKENGRKKRKKKRIGPEKNWARKELGQKRREKRKIEIDWALTHLISIGLFNSLGPGPVGPSIRQLKAQAQSTMDTDVNVKYVHKVL
jgi:hypothetical protein